MKKFIFLVLFLLLAGCVNIPEDIKAVDGFDINRYAGTWYEIARFENKFEKRMTKVSALYTLRKDGGMDILNSSYNPETNKLETAKGKAYLISNSGIGRFKVSYSWPFYNGYNIIALDKEKYSYALVCGNDKSYLWILSRTKNIGYEKANELIDMARAFGFDVNKLFIVDQDENK